MNHLCLKIECGTDLFLHSIEMAALSLVLVSSLLYIGAVDCGGSPSKSRRSSRVCYYENVENAHFSYDRRDCKGPKNWCTLNECWTTCGSKRRQTPINISTRKAIFVGGLKDFVLENAHKKVPATISNNGHAPGFNIAVDENNGNNILLSNVPQRPSYKKYVFAQLHVHVGRKSEKGSEHSIDGKFYPMEAHMVFYDSEFDDIGKAKSAKDGLVVIGVMLKVITEILDGKTFHQCASRIDEFYRLKFGDTCITRKNVKRRDGDEEDEDVSGRGERKGGKCGRCRVRFAKTLSLMMEKYYKKVKENTPSRDSQPQQTVPMDLVCGKSLSQKTIEEKCTKKGSENSDVVSVPGGISPLDVLPYDQRFYTYPGSLTTPPCYETVQWIVLKCPIIVSRGAFEALRNVKDSHGDPLSNMGTRRPLQRNKRQTVLKNF